MDYTLIINELERNRDVFSGLLAGLDEQEVLWKPQPAKWCLLEIVCHLFDEERKDFRYRLRHTLTHPDLPLPSIDPVGWVTQRKYLDQNYNEKLSDFLTEREESIRWLHSFQNPEWTKAYDHPKLGKLTAKMFLANWLAHDYPHFRQITRLKFQYLQTVTGETLDYAGKW